MTIVLDALASYIQNMLTNVVKEEVHMLLGVPKEIIKLDFTLRDIKKFLTDADRRNITDESVQAWVKELRDAMYDATDILDMCHLKAMEPDASRDIGCFNPLLLCMRNPLHAHDIGIRLKNLNEKLENISKRSTIFNFINLTFYEDRGEKIESSILASRETTGELDKNGVVGDMIEEDTRNFVELLTRKEDKTVEQNRIMVFAIVGVGGIGKTTLAQNIFNNEIINAEFKKKMWLSVNQGFNDLDLLKRAITEAGGDHQAPKNTKASLVQTLKKALEGQKTFLVMDDVWDHHAWERVLKTPLINTLARGSCVLVTTRHDSVARGMKAEKPYHHVKKLESEYAWSLLKKKVFVNEIDEFQVDMLKDIGLKIVAKCDGLPLAIKVMGGLLLQKRNRRNGWEKVLNDSIWSVSELHEELNYAIYLSYQDLHPSLKSCFLHFSLLPKSTIFFIDDIVGMWISEGFVHGNSSDLEDIAKDYYDELIERNLIEPNGKYVDHQVCNMHDVVRSFAQYVARDEALTTHNGKMDINDKVHSQKFIRLSLETKGPESIELDWISLQAHISLRTLISVGHVKIKHGDSLTTFSRLRTLHIQDADFDVLTVSLVQLKHLRYLSIENTNTSVLPEGIGKMKLLQYISLLGCKSLRNLPSTIVKLQNLRFLNLVGTNIKNIPKGLSNLNYLRRLHGFPAYMDGEWCSLEELGPLSKLTLLQIQSLENISSSLFAQKARLGEKVHLTHLCLDCGIAKDAEDASNKRQQQIEEVFDELYPPSCLEHLVITGYFGQRLPRWIMSAAVAPLGSLRILVMKDLPCCTELPDGLCYLPCLEILQIYCAPTIRLVGREIIQPHHHDDRRALDSMGSAAELQLSHCPGLERIANLPKTQVLRIINCPKLKVLKGMSALQRLVLEDYNMETLPGYLQDVKPIHLHVDCDVSLLTSMAAGKSGREWDKFSHIKQVKAYAGDKDNHIKRKWYVVYTRDPFNFKTNIIGSAIAQGKVAHQVNGLLFIPFSRTG